MNFKKSLYPISFFAVVIVMMTMIGKSNISFAQDDKKIQPTLPADQPVQPLVIVDKVLDSFPNGCVSCHINTGKENEDYRLITVLGQIQKHPKISIVKNVPDDCKKCHSENKRIGTLSEVIHRAHYIKADKSGFVINYGGKCIHCHSIDTVAWRMKVKSGERNW